MKSQATYIPLSTSSINMSSYAVKFKVIILNAIDSLKHIDTFSGSVTKRRSRLSGIKLPKLPSLKRFNWRYLVYVLVVIGVLVGGSKLVASNNEGESTGEEIQISEAKATQAIDKEYTFPLRDAEGETISDIKYYIDKAELRDEIIVQGKRATAIKGRDFLIITIKVSNEYDQAINMNVKDYARLSVNGNTDEWLAPDINNDPVEIQAISTKQTRLGFPINETDTNLILRVGEINGDKEEIPLTF